MGRVGTDRKDNFHYLSFLAFSNQILIERRHNGIFFNFLKILAIFLEFSIMRRVGTEQNDNFYFLSFFRFPNLFWTEMTP